LILLVIVLAIPLSWYVCQKWLSGFNYSTTMDWWIFVFSGVLVILIAILTVSSQAIKAALLNPVDSLRSE
jgi:putative ABC transport system permease protein